MAFRTPEEAFANVQGFPYTPRYHDVDGLRIAYLDEGDPGAPPVWFMHGEPTWSYLWRTVIPPVRDAGFRCIAPDLPGFGRSDKPTDVSWYSYDRHTATMAALL
jgi:haloalkane dehalogenase